MYFDDKVISLLSTKQYRCIWDMKIIIHISVTSCSSDVQPKSRGP
jgi:hypothetical protein